jgi:hypothetical protein
MIWTGEEIIGTKYTKSWSIDMIRDGDSLWVKLVVSELLLTPIRPSNIQASVTVSR